MSGRGVRREGLHYYVNPFNNLSSSLRGLGGRWRGGGDENL